MNLKSRKKILLATKILSLSFCIVVSIFVAPFFAIVPILIFAATLVWIANYFLKMHGRIAKGFCIVVVVFFAVFPGKSDTRKYTNNDALFTAQYSGPLTFRTVDQSWIEGNYRRTWHRIHFGFPTAATTVDISTEGHGMLGVIEPFFLIANVLFGLAAFSLTLGCFALFISIKRKLTGSRN